MVNLSGIFLAFYRSANRFHISAGGVRLVSVVPWYFVSGPANLNVQRMEDDRHATRSQQVKSVGLAVDAREQEQQRNLWFGSAVILSLLWVRETGRRHGYQ